MQLFKRKKEEGPDFVEDNEDFIGEEPKPTKVIEAKSKKKVAKSSKEKKLSAEAKELASTVEDYKKYHGIFRAEDFVGTTTDIDKLTLGFAIFGELRQIRKLLEKK
jgi:hypothetical protein